MGAGGYPLWVNDSCWGSRITFLAPGLADVWHLRGRGRGRLLLINYMRKLIESCHGIGFFVFCRTGGISAVAE